jgi:hypothetical protein
MLKLLVARNAFGHLLFPESMFDASPELAIWVVPPAGPSAFDEEPTLGHGLKFVHHRLLEPGIPGVKSKCARSRAFACAVLNELSSLSSASSLTFATALRLH